MSNKKICIVTNYSTTTNYGALLQAYALNRAITDIGYCPKDLYFVENSISRREKLIYQIIHFQIKRIINELESKLRKFRVRKHLEKRKKTFDSFRFSIPHTERTTRNDLKYLDDKYDVFICGSDQIFRPNRNTDELEDYYFLSMVNNGIKASYAASIGIDSYSPKNEEIAIKYLSSFDGLSLREANSAEYIRKITGRDDVICSIDPVFLIDKDKWNNISKPYQVDYDYILVYMIHGTAKLYESIKDFSKLTHLKILSFPSMSYRRKKYEMNFADKEILDADPLHFISLLKNASYIFTDSFHGTAFSMILHKEAFVSQANQIAFSRIENILEMFQCTDLIIPPDGLAPKEYLIKKSINWDYVDKAIKEQQEASIKYLKTIIEYTPNKPQNKEESYV